MMKDNLRSANWPLIAGIAGVAALVGFGVARGLVPSHSAAPAAKTAAAPEKAAPTEVKVPLEYLATANIAVEPVATAGCLLYTSPSPRDGLLSRMPSSA